MVASTGHIENVPGRVIAPGQAVQVTARRRRIDEKTWFGLQLIAPAWAEERLLAIALAAERVLGTATERLGIPTLLA